MKSLGLETSGRKADLVSRLEEYITTRDAAQPDASAAVDEATAEPATEPAAQVCTMSHQEGFCISQPKHEQQLAFLPA